MVITYGDMEDIIRAFLRIKPEELESGYGLDIIKDLNDELKRGLLTLRYFSTDWEIITGCGSRIFVKDRYSDYVAEINIRDKTFKFGPEYKTSTSSEDIQCLTLKDKVKLMFSNLLDLDIPGLAIIVIVLLVLLALLAMAGMTSNIIGR